MILELENGVFLDCKNVVKGYIVFDINTRKKKLSRNVIFYEMFSLIKTNKIMRQPRVIKKMKMFFLITFYVVMTVMEYKTLLRMTIPGKDLLKVKMSTLTIASILLRTKNVTVREDSPELEDS